MNEIQAIFDEQNAYYQARAAEYDEWWQRKGRYDLGTEGNAAWDAETKGIAAVFDAIPLKGHILEPAGGTGIWTGYLAARGARVTVLDGSSNMIKVNQAKMKALERDAQVDYQRGDLLSWEPDREYDAVFLAFFISHLPSPMLDPFFRKMGRALKPGGLMVILEGQLGGRKSPDQGTFKIEEEMEVRTLNDGRRFRIFKRYDTPEGLAARLEHSGFKAKVLKSGEQFLCAIAEKGDAV